MIVEQKPARRWADEIGAIALTREQAKGEWPGLESDTWGVIDPVTGRFVMSPEELLAGRQVIASRSTSHGES